MLFIFRSSSPLSPAPQSPLSLSNLRLFKGPELNINHKYCVLVCRYTPAIADTKSTSIVPPLPIGFPSLPYSYQLFFPPNFLPPLPTPFFILFSFLLPLPSFLPLTIFAPLPTNFPFLLLSFPLYVPTSFPLPIFLPLLTSVPFPPLFLPFFQPAFLCPPFIPSFQPAFNSTSCHNIFFHQLSLSHPFLPSLLTSFPVSCPLLSSTLPFLSISFLSSHQL